MFAQALSCTLYDRTTPLASTANCLRLAEWLVFGCRQKALQLTWIIHDEMSCKTICMLTAMSRCTQDSQCAAILKHWADLNVAKHAQQSRPRLPRTQIVQVHRLLALLACVAAEKCPPIHHSFT